MEGADLTLNASEFFESLAPTIMNQLSPLIKIFEVIGIAILVYILFLVVRTLFNMRTSSRIGRIARNVEEINEKLDSIVPKKEKEKEKKKK